MSNDNAYMSKYMKSRYHQKMDEWKRRFGGKCVRCGSVENLHFHHIDPSTKTNSIAKLWARREEVVEAELVKCELLCKICHDEEHACKHPCGTPQRYWAGCKCSACKAAHAAHCRTYRKTVHPTRKPIEHGTRAMYLKEGRLGIERCEKCKRANAEYTRNLRNKGL